MALLTEAQVLRRATAATTLRKSAAREILTETASLTATFDVFLSHSSAEPENILLGVKGYLEDAGLTVYVDRYTDSQLSPEKVTRDTAGLLRSRMRASNALLYIHSRHSKTSRWMPWELGFFDGLKGRVGIMPVVQSASDQFEGQEYLGLYPYVDCTMIEGKNTPALWINATPTAYAFLPKWLRGQEKIQKRN
jgi:hypothetical protein